MAGRSLKSVPSTPFPKATLRGLAEYLKTAPKLDETDAPRHRGRHRGAQQPRRSRQSMGTLIDTKRADCGRQRGQIDLDAIVDTEGDDDVRDRVRSAPRSCCTGRTRLPTEVAREPAPERAVEHLLEQFPILMFDMDIARVHARLWPRISALAARRSGAHDLMIAATALAGEYRIATRDMRSFRMIPGLDVVHW